MRRKFTIVLAAVLAVSPMAVAQQAPDTGRGTARPIVAAALMEATRLGRAPQATSIAAKETGNQSDLWGQLQTLPAGTRVRVTLREGAELEGELVEIRTDVIVLQNSLLRKGQFRSTTGTSLRDGATLQRSDVSSVLVFQNGRFVQPGQQTREPRTWPGRHPVLTGFLIGAGVGALAGITNGGCVLEYGAHCPGLNAALLAGPLGGIGALIGLAF